MEVDISRQFCDDGIRENFDCSGIALSKAKRPKKPASSHQAIDLFPVDVTNEYPRPSGADVGGKCRAADGQEYVWKGAEKNARLPHSEWFCTGLGEVVNVPGPPTKILRRLDGTLVFGSRWEGGIPRETWLQLVVSGKVEPDALFRPLSRILAFDWFVHNVDRHVGNFICRMQSANYALLANDYSRAWLHHGWPLPHGLLSASCSTRKALTQFKKVLGDYLQFAEVQDLLEKLGKVGVPTIENLIRRHPKDWLDEKTEESILTWWESDARASRLEKIEKELQNEIQNL